VHERGVLVAALCGSVEHALRHAEAGIDIIRRAGLGRAVTPARSGRWSSSPTSWTRSRRGPCSRGGIGCGRQIAAALALGADGAWMAPSGSRRPRATLPRRRAEAPGGVVARYGPVAFHDRQAGAPAATKWTEAWDDPAVSPGTLDAAPVHAHGGSDQRIHHHAHVELRVRRADRLARQQIVGRMKTVRPVRGVVYDMMNEFVDAMSRVCRLLDE
jgi:hypothetical protein